MRGFRFLLSRRWILFGLVVVVLAAGTWWLGQWQFDRLEDRRGANSVVEANEAREPSPVEQVMPVGSPVEREQEWRQVSATGTYAVEETVIVRYRTGSDGTGGVNVVVPLVTEQGTALIVDRGFLRTDNRVITAEEVPPPPAGEVTITGWVRVDGTGSSTQVVDLATRAISSVAIGEAIDRPVFGGFVDLVSENPEPATTLLPRPLPDLDDGPHFFYGLQWWFFGILALFGFGYLAYDERKRGPRGERPHRRRPARDRTGSGPPEQEQGEDDAAGAPRRSPRTNLPAAYQRPRSGSRR